MNYRPRPLPYANVISTGGRHAHGGPPPPLNYRFNAPAEEDLADWARQRERSRERMAEMTGPAHDQWQCFKCFINNFGRSSCFKCGTPRQSLNELDAKGLSMVGAAPCDTLLIRELPSTATEASVRAAITRGTELVPRHVLLAATRLFAFVQMRTMQDAMVAHQTLRKTCPYIDNSPVIVTFSRQPLDQVLDEGRIELLPPESRPADLHSEQRTEGNGTVNTPFGVLPIYPVPDPKKFRYEPSSGYFYDHETDFYYDSRTEYFYTSKGNKWIFWCDMYRTYIDCEGGDLELKRRLQETVAGEESGSGRKNQQQAAPRAPDHRDALRNAPPPPSRPTAATSGGGGGGGERRPLLLQLEDDSDKDADVVMVKSGMHKKKQRKRQQQDQQENMMVSDHSREKEKQRQAEEQEIMVANATKMSSGSKSIETPTTKLQPTDSPMVAALRDSLRQNQILVSQLREQLIAARDQRQIGGIQAQLDILLSQQRNLETTIADAGASIGERRVQVDQRQEPMEQSTPQLKRHITKEPIHPAIVKRPPSIVDLDEESPPMRHKPSGSILKHRSISPPSPGNSSWRGDNNNAFQGRHVDEGERLKRPSERDIGLSQLVGQMVERSMDEEWRNYRERDRDRPQPSGRRRPASRSPSPQPPPMHRSRHDEEWRERDSRRRPAMRSPSPQPPPIHRSRLNEEWRDVGGREKERRSSHFDDESRRRHHHDHDRRHRSRSSSRDRDHRRSPRFDRRDERMLLVGQEPMAMSPSPPPPQGMLGESWAPRPGDLRGPLPPEMLTPLGRPMMPPDVDPRMMMSGGPNDPRMMMMRDDPRMTMSGGPIGPHMMMRDDPRMTMSGGPNDPRMMMRDGPPMMMPGGGGGYGSKMMPQFSPPRPVGGGPGTGMMMGPRIPGGYGGAPNPLPIMNTPGVPPSFMSSSGGGRDFGLQFRNPLMDQQRRFPSALSSSAASMSRRPTPINELAMAQRRALDDMRKKRELATKERDKVRDLGICFNCGRQGHSQFNCRYERISDDELQKKIRLAREKKQKQELEKEQAKGALKRKADKYMVRRNDPLIKRLRASAPSGKISKETIRMICPKCAYFNHTRAQCSRDEISRTLHKEICQALEEFTKVFFVHLQEENMIDLSQKFDTFLVMDGIEQNGTIDPVGLQLHGLCPDGIVTQMDLRDLCSNCAQLGHKRPECKEKDECSRTLFDKMLTLVKGYRALVKEGNGNFLLPRTNMDPSALVLKDIERSGPIEEILLLDSSSESDGEIAAEKDAGTDKQATKNSDGSKKQTTKESTAAEKQTTKDLAASEKQTTKENTAAEKQTEEDDDDVIVFDWPAANGKNANASKTVDAVPAEKEADKSGEGEEFETTTVAQQNGDSSEGKTADKDKDNSKDEVEEEDNDDVVLV